MTVPRWLQVVKRHDPRARKSERTTHVKYDISFPRYQVAHGETHLQPYARSKEISGTTARSG